MDSIEIVRKAIEFDIPPRLPFFLGGSWSDRLSAIIRNFPNDVCDCGAALSPNRKPEISRLGSHPACGGCRTP